MTSTRLHLALSTLLLAALPVCTAQEAGALHAEQHEFVLRNFKTESGVVLPEARLVYGTYGKLNGDGSNAILLPSHYMANLHGYEWLMKTARFPAGALDPEKLFLVTSELFGNGRSSSPSNTPEPFHGPRFPVMTIRDNVNAVHQMLTEQLHVRHLRAVIGFSMGAQQALQWSVSYPTFMDRVVATSGTAKTYGHGIVRNEGEITAITADCTFNNGDYSSEPAKGIETFSIMWTGWLYSQQWWRDELWRRPDRPGLTLQQFIDERRQHFIAGADANDLILQLRTWNSNDVGASAGFGGNEKKALASIQSPVLYMPSATDLYFPVGDARYESQYIAHVTLMPIPSLWGHPAGAGASPADKAFLNRNIAAFLAGEPLVGEHVMPSK